MISDRSHGARRRDRGGIAVRVGRIRLGGRHAAVLSAPVPIVVVALGWSHWAALIAAVTAAAWLAVEGVIVLIVFLLGIGLPAWWLGFLTLLSRPAPTPEGHEWYPVGRLVLWAACISALIVGATMLSLGPDLASLQDVLRSALKVALMMSSGTTR
jgi:hypothetical protein